MTAEPIFPGNIRKTREDKDVMNDTRSQLNSLLAYWLEHNVEHGAEFREWADKIAVEHADIAEQLRKAADKMAEADGHLNRAQQLLK